MKAKEYLKQLERLDEIIGQKLEHKAELRERLFGIQSANPNAEIVSRGNDNNASFTKRLHKYIETEEEIEKLIDEYVDQRNLIVKQIHSLNNINHIKVLFRRYVMRKSFEAIAVELNYNYDYVRQLNASGLQEFERKILNPNQTQKVHKTSHKISGPDVL